jgi:tetratricopeptide (TPR) repeat protein
MHSLLYISGFLFWVLIAKLLSIIVHELGHAIPALLLTRQKVTVYLGSHGIKENSWNFSLGKLDIWLKYNLFSWGGGLCVPTKKNISLNRQIVFTFCGPLASLFLCATTAYLLFYFEMNFFLQLNTFVLLALSSFTFISSGIPANSPSFIYEGSEVYNDGRRILNLYRYKRINREYLKAVELCNKKEFIESSRLFDKFIDKTTMTAEVYRYAIVANINAARYDRGIEMYEKLKAKYTLNSDDYCKLGILRGYLGQEILSIEAFHNSLEINPDNYYSLVNRGYLRNLFGKFEEATIDFKKAIFLNPNLSHAYSNLGLSKIKLGDVESGLNDINKSLEIDPFDSGAHKNLGIYHLEKNDKVAAVKCFTRAKELDKNLHLIDLLLTKALTLS